MAKGNAGGPGHSADLFELAQRDAGGFGEALGIATDKQLSAVASRLEEAKLYLAEEHVRRVLLERRPGDAGRCLELGFNLYYYQRKHQDAERLLAEGTKRSPKDAGLAYQRGVNLAWGLGRHAEALPELERAVKLEDDDAAHHAGLAWCLLWLGHTTRGVTHCKRGIELADDEDDDALLATHFYLYAFGDAADRTVSWEAIVKALGRGIRVEDWDVSGLLARIPEDHPEAAHIQALSLVVFGNASPFTLVDWAPWRAARPDDALLARAAELAKRVGAQALFDVAVRERLEVYSKEPPFKMVPFTQVHPTADELMSAIQNGNERAVLMSMTALGALEAEGALELGLAFLAAQTHYFPRAGIELLSRSRDDRALAPLLATLEPSSSVREGSLAASVHPAISERVRAVLDELDVEHLTPGPHVEKARRAIYVLGVRKDAASLERLLRVFAMHPLEMLRRAALHALQSFDDPRVHAAIDAAWNDPVERVAESAVRASFDRDPTRAWDCFATHIQLVVEERAQEASTLVVRRLLECIGKADFDPRFYELAVKLRKRVPFQHYAKKILETLPRTELDELLTKLEPKKRAPKKQRARLPQRRDFLARYMAGEHEVWSELVKHSEAVAQHPDLHEEAMAVARSLMKRVRQNADTLRETLTKAGAKLEKETPPSRSRDLARLSKVVGRLPIALEAFWSVVGSIQLQPPYVKDQSPSYGQCSLENDGIWMPGLDPLQLDGADVDYLTERYEEEQAEAHEELAEPFLIDLAPDYLHKQNVSGGSPYSVQLSSAPSECLDPDLLEADDTLVGYLRKTFELGGFPLLEQASKPKKDIYINYRVPFEKVKGAWGPPAKRLLGLLKRDLIPF